VIQQKARGLPRLRVCAAHPRGQWAPRDYEGERVKVEYTDTLINQRIYAQSDHPVLNSRYLMYEAQQAHYHSLNTGLAIASVTSTPAKALGVGWRIGTIAEGGCLFKRSCRC
jgi:hypothetical protein